MSAARSHAHDSRQPGPGRHVPALHVAAGGAVATRPSGSFQWALHEHGDEPIAFLATSLLALGAGEALEVDVEVAPGARAIVATQGPASLLETSREAVQRWSLRLAPGARLTFLPWLTLPFAGSRSVLEVSAELGEGAVLVAWDALAAGRIAHGERLAFAELASSWRIAGPAGVVLDERLRARGDDARELDAALGGLTHVGSCHVAGLDDAALPVADVRQLLVSGLELVGASRPAPDLLTARALDRSGERLEQGLWPLVALARAAAGSTPLDPNRVARRWFGRPGAQPAGGAPRRAT